MSTEKRYQNQSKYNNVNNKGKKGEGTRYQQAEQQQPPHRSHPHHHDQSYNQSLSASPGNVGNYKTANYH